MNRIVILLAAMVFMSASLFAQMPPASKPDAELTKEEATLRIQDFQARISALQEKLNELNAKAASLTSQIDDVKMKLDDCEKELMRLIGATDADVTAFAQQLGQLEGKVREMQRLSNDELADRQDQVKALEAEYMELRNNKIALLPKFYERVVKLGNDIKGLYREKSIKSYTVGTWAENRDCLWNIAGNIEIYGDPHLWPKIWVANDGKIRNPDIIYPGQVLTIPKKAPKTSEELKKERTYWRNKKEAQAEAGADNAAGENTTGTTE